MDHKEGRIAGPFSSPPLGNFRTSPIGVVPKKEHGKFRMITDLSAPVGQSINDFISDSESSVSFNHFDEAVKIVAKLGRNSQMAKIDVKSAFRICPVRPEDWHLLGFSFQGLFYVDLCLPFGLRSSVNRFTQLASTILWIMQNNYGIGHSTHYLDDYFLAGPPGTQSCQRSMNETISLFEKLGVPLAPEKIIGPSYTISYLGIEIDSKNMELRLPSDKMSELLSLLNDFRNKKKCTKRELLSLIGKLSFASKIIPSSRTFIRRLIDLSKSVQKLSHHVSLNCDARSDIQWWVEFLPSWNGKYKILDPMTTYASSLNLFTDASGLLGFGVYYNGKWISCKWPARFVNHSIQWKELFPIYVACFIWAPDFFGKRLVFHCDNLSVVNIWSSKTSKCPHLMSLLRKLFYISAEHNFTVNVKHIPGTDNSIADALSRQQIDRFRFLAPSAVLIRTQIPDPVWEL